MSASLRARIIRHATERRHVPKWKAILYGCIYGASLPVLSKLAKSK